MSGFVMENFTTLYGGICRYKNAKSLRYFGIKLIPPNTALHSRSVSMRGREPEGMPGREGKMAQARSPANIKDLISHLRSNNFYICFLHILRL
jgi:hypothetical protein